MCAFRVLFIRKPILGGFGELDLTVVRAPPPVRPDFSADSSMLVLTLLLGASGPVRVSDARRSRSAAPENHMTHRRPSR
jgi:hypothetical protein